MYKTYTPLDWQPKQLRCTCLNPRIEYRLACTLGRMAPSSQGPGSPQASTARVASFRIDLKRGNIKTIAKKNFGYEIFHQNVYTLHHIESNKQLPSEWPESRNPITSRLRAPENKKYAESRGKNAHHSSWKLSETFLRNLQSHEYF